MTLRFVNFKHGFTKDKGMKMNEDESEMDPASCCTCFGI